MKRIRIGFPLRNGRRLARARRRWRDAAHLVAVRWDAFGHADAGMRAIAFGAYLTALDAEEAAAAAIAALTSSPLSPNPKGASSCPASVPG
jgi:hypothetical protein